MRRRKHRNGCNWIWKLAFLASVAIPAAGARAQISPPSVYDLNAMRYSPYPNLLRPTSAALDPVRSLLYAHSVEFDHVAVFKIYTGWQIRSIPLPPGVGERFRLLHVHDKTGLVVAGLEGWKGGDSLIAALDPLTGALLPAFNPAAEGTPVFVSHPDENRIYMSTGRRHILLLNGAALTPEDSIDAGIPVSCLSLDSLHANLYATQRLPSEGQVRVRAFSTLNGQMTRSFVYGSEAAAARIAVDPLSERFALFTDAGVRIYDEFGIFIRDLPLAAGVSATASSAPSRGLLFLADSAGRHAGVPRRNGKLYRYNFLTGAFDSVSTGLDANMIFVTRASDAGIIVNPGVSTARVFHIPSLSFERTLEFGRSVEDAALTADGSKILYTDAFGGGGLNYIETSSGRGRRIAAGERPVALERVKTSGRAAVHDHFGHVIRVLDEELPAVSDSIRAGEPDLDRTDAFAAMAFSSDGKAAVAMPAAGRVDTISLFGSQGPPLGVLRGWSYAGRTGTGVAQAVFTPNDSILAVKPVDGPLYVWHVKSGIQDAIEVPDCRGPFERLCLRQGYAPNEVFAGRYRVDCKTRTISPVLVDDPFLALGSAAGGIYLALTVSGDSLVLLRGDNPDFAGAGRLPLPLSRQFPNVARFDERNGALILGYARDALILLYRLGNVLASARPPEITDQIILYPNPLRAGAGSLNLRLPDRLRGSALETELFTALGSRRATAGAIQEEEGGLILRFDGLRPGMYFLHVRGASVNAALPLMVLGR